MKRLGLTLLLLTLTQTAMAGSFLQFMFPMLKPTERRVDQTLNAPFLNEDERTMAEQAVLNAQSDPERLMTQHRPTTEITEWLERDFPLILSFNGTERTESRGQFSDVGWSEFNRFLNESDYKNYINNTEYRVKTIVTETPVCEQKGSASGFYYWVYEMPIETSFLSKNLTDYRRTQNVNRQTYILNLLVRRAAEADNEHNVLIERIRIRDRQNTKILNNC